MISREDMFKQFVEQYKIDVPESMVKNELRYITLEMKHRMQYDTLTGGGPHLLPQAELDGQAEELRRAAFYEVKSGLVIKAVIAAQKFTVTKEELAAEAAAMAERQNTTVAMIKSFFGENLAMLERDVKERKAVDWICKQMQHAEIR